MTGQIEHIPRLKYIDKRIDNITIGNRGWVDIVQYRPTGHEILFTTLVNFGTVSTFDAICLTSAGGYILGTKGATIDYVLLRYFYLE